MRAAETRVALGSLSSSRLETISHRHPAPASVRSLTQLAISELKQAAKSGSNETLFKDSLSLFDDLDYINAGSQRQKVIEIFKQAGYTQWPDGRKLEDVIK